MNLRLRWALGLIVVAVAAIVLIGVGQGHPGPQLPVSPSAATAAQRRIAKLGREGRAGQAVFTAQGCNACHTIGVSGYGGRLGPNLDAYLHGTPKAGIEEYILKPSIVHIPGYTHNLMPNDFGSRIGKAQLRALVAYIHAAAG